jgi:hypothetical protein
MNRYSMIPYDSQDKVDLLLTAIGMIVMAVSRKIVTGSEIPDCAETLYNARGTEGFHNPSG